MNSLVRIEVRDATGAVRTTDDTSVDAAKDWLWRTVLDAKTNDARFGPAMVRIWIVQ